MISTCISLKNVSIGIKVLEKNMFVKVANLHFHVIIGSFACSKRALASGKRPFAAHKRDLTY